MLESYSVANSLLVSATLRAIMTFWASLDANPHPSFKQHGEAHHVFIYLIKTFKKLTGFAKI